MRRGGTIWVAALAVLCLARLAEGDERNQRYVEGDEVTLWANKVGPYENPQETYPYYMLPFCKVDKANMVTRWAGLGEALEGNSLVKSDYDIHFKKDVTRKNLCAKTMDATSIHSFKVAVQNHYWFNLVLDELPMWAMVGEMAETHLGNVTGAGKTMVYTHKEFSIAYNGDRVIEVNLTNDHSVELVPGEALPFSYSVTWKPTTRRFAARFHRYLDQDFFEHQIHWFSIFNSFMMVVFLVGLVALILMRTLKSDLHKYRVHMDEEDPLGETPEDTGWKQVQGDVFRFPPYFPLLCGLVGTGIQLILMVYGTTLLSIIGTLYVGRGAVSSTAVLVYALSSFAAGAVSGRMYVESRGLAWIKTMAITALGFSAFSLLVSFFLNALALSYASLAAVPAGTALILFAIWFLVSCPLVLLGTILGRTYAKPFHPPTRVSQIPRQIPDKRWYLQHWAVVPLGGLLPFGSIFIEMYFIFTSFWNYKFYYVYGFVLLVFSILIVVCTCVSIVVTYFLLNSEDYRWPWTAFLSSASTALYVFAYATYYFFFKTKMYGLFQTMFYFGQTAVMCAGLGIVCGSVGYLGARAFVFRIFSGVKSD